MTAVDQDQRTPTWQWIVLLVLALVLPPVTLVLSCFGLVYRPRHEQVAWSTLLVLSLLLTIGFLVIRLK